jgi:hypothetical protein
VRWAAALAEIARTTDWEVVVHPAPHQEQLAAAARRALPAGLVAQGPASLRFDQQLVTLRCSGSASPTELAEAQARFSEETGWRLAIVDAAGR